MIEHMIEECISYHPELEDAEFYIPNGEAFCLIAIDADGTKWMYDSTDNSLRNQTHKEKRDSEDRSELHYRTEIARYLDRKMRHNGFTVKTLSEETGISQVTINNYLNGDTSPSVYRLNIIERALGLEPGEIMSRAMKAL